MAGGIVEFHVELLASLEWGLAVEKAPRPTFAIAQLGDNVERRSRVRDDDNSFAVVATAHFAHEPVENDHFARRGMQSLFLLLRPARALGCGVVCNVAAQEDRMVADFEELVDVGKAIFLLSLKGVLEPASDDVGLY